MLFKKIFPFLVIAVWSVFLSSALSAQPQDVAEAARKAKAKKQQQQAEAGSTTTTAAMKPKTFTNDDFPSSGGSGYAKEGQPVAFTPSIRSDSGLMTMVAVGTARPSTKRFTRMRAQGTTGLNCEQRPLAES